jgi:hypothetical protein
MKLDGLRLLEDSTIIVSDGLLTACAARFADAASSAVDKAVASGKLAAAPSSALSSASGKGSGKASVDDWSDDEDEDQGKRGKGKKKNRSSRALLKQEAAAESKSRKSGKTGKKDSSNRGGGGNNANSSQEGDASSNRGGRAGSQQVEAAALTPSIQAMAKDMQAWYEEHEMSREVAEGLADVLRPELVRTYVEAHSSAFAAMAEGRKKKQLAFESILQQTADNFALFHKGAETLGNPAARVQLAQHLLKEHGTDIVASESSRAQTCHLVVVKLRWSCVSCIFGPHC